MSAPGLSTLKRRALEATRARGHRMTWDAPWHGEAKSLQRGTCSRCGAEADLNTHPLPNGAAVLGPALAVDCKRAVQDLGWGK